MAKRRRMTLIRLQNGKTIWVKSFYLRGAWTGIDEEFKIGARGIVIAQMVNVKKKCLK